MNFLSTAETDNCTRNYYRCDAKAALLNTNEFTYWHLQRWSDFLKMGKKVLFVTNSASV